MLTELVVCALTGLHVVSAHSHYQLLIPNGHQVPSPCDTADEGVWMGVGHRNPAGGGARNLFGLDFAKHDHNWTRVCGLDSDGDGRTNGQELGDPNCTWKPGQTALRAHHLSHPGVCEPKNSTLCLRKNSWLKCRKPTSCQSLADTLTAAVLKKPLRLPATAVPAAKDTHMCFGINLPGDIVVNSQLPIALEPILDNTVVMHHMNFWRCSDVPEESYSTPRRCARSRRECPAARRLRLWTTGQNVRCTAAKQLDLPANGTDLPFKYAVLELHWRNELLSTEHIDGSGVMLYYRDIEQTSGPGKSLAAADHHRSLNSMVVLSVVLLAVHRHHSVFN